MPLVSAILDAHQLAGAIKRRARELGFDLVGITDARPSAYRDYLRNWLDDGRAGTMDYLANRFDERTDPGVVLPGARSVICVAINYQVPLGQVQEEERAQHGRIARYALGGDYHDPLKHRLYDLADWLRETVPGSKTKTGVDTAPLMEKELAARAGIGWQGKNTCVISPEIGSWLLLGEIITTVDLPHDEPVLDRCGTCARCIDACPTAAITAPYQLDASKCVSYLTIEHRGDIEADLQAKMEDWLYGCDVCQEVCPWNAKAPTATDPLLQPRFKTGTLDLREVLSWGIDEYRATLRRSAIKRVKLPVLQRNATIALRNNGKDL
jgi:epoxyqueuosine reductase